MYTDVFSTQQSLLLLMIDDSWVFSFIRTIASAATSQTHHLSCTQLLKYTSSALDQIFIDGSFVV